MKEKVDSRPISIKKFLTNGYYEHLLASFEEGSNDTPQSYLFGMFFDLIRDEEIGLNGKSSGDFEEYAMNEISRFINEKGQ